MTRGRKGRRALAYGPSGSPLEAITTKMVACAQAVESQNVAETMKRVGVQGRKLVDWEIRKDFGADQAMSNWRRRRPVRMYARFDQPKPNELEFQALPQGGFWWVAEKGRRPGRRGVGEKRTRTRRRPSSWGASRGKQTWSRSMAVLEDKGTALYAKVQRDKVIDAFKKG